MSRDRADFVRVRGPEPHRQRRRELLRRHPEARSLEGRAPVSAALVVLLVAAQVAAAWVLRGSPWWMVLAAAWLAGAFATHALWVLIHECTHDLVLASPAANLWLAMVANLPILFPSAVSFRKYHLLHHAFQGQPELDADLPSPLEARLVGRSRIAKALWLLFFFAAQGLRVRRLRSVPFFDRWYAANLAVEALFVAAVVAFAGWTAFAYLFLSSVFAIGLHPVGARWIQEHYLVFPGEQETFSYYGPLNALAFNVGYHVEHHDLMRVAWPRLPALRRLAPELYEPLHSHRSWTGLMLRFILDRSVSLHSRAVRDAEAEPRDGEAVDAAEPAPAR